MKKIFSFVIFPLIAIMMFFGCGCSGDKTIADINNSYLNMINEFKVEGRVDFFADTSNPKAISIPYSPVVQQAIENNSMSNDLQKRYKGLYYQQMILNNIFVFYDYYQENFYRNINSDEIDQEKVQNLYNELKDLKDTLKDFEGYFTSFNETAKNGISDLLEFSITSYTYRVNILIDKSFDFVQDFSSIYIEECIDDYSQYNEHNLNFFVDKAYLDLSYIVYLENIKAFNYSVGNNGICDLADVVGSDNKYNLLQFLSEEKKRIAINIQDNIADENVIETLNLFVYARNIFDQRSNNYLNTYNAIDMYNINQYRFGLNSSVSYESYLTSLTASEKANIIMLDNFLNDNFLTYMEKLKTITE